MANMEPEYSIIVPAHNEARTIGIVLEALCQTNASEIIVIDDGSIDNTREIVLSKKDARIACLSHTHNLGQGNAWKTGIRHSKSQILVFFDADIETATSAMITKLVDPILTGDVDFVIGSFENFGRITEYLVRPIFRHLVPELSNISQPLSGLFAIKREFIYPYKIGDRYITSGIVLDAFFSGARIKDVNLGEIKHDKRSDQEKVDQANSEFEALLNKLVEYQVINVSPQFAKIKQNASR